MSEKKESPKNFKAEFECDVHKFIKMIEFVKQVRNLQNEYFSTKSKEVLEKCKLAESRLDKALDFYIKNKNELYNLPF